MANLVRKPGFKENTALFRLIEDSLRDGSFLKAIVRPTDYKVLHRPPEPARVTGHLPCRYAYLYAMAALAGPER